MPEREGIHKATFRIPKDLWKKVKVKAIKEDRTITEIIVECLKKYVEEQKDKEE